MLTGSHWCQKKHWPRECRPFKTAITMRDARTPAKPEREILLTLYTPRAGMLAGSIIAGLNDEREEHASLAATYAAAAPLTISAKLEPAKA
jgi:hypothetical protein